MSNAVAVRTLCEFIARRGDIDLRYSPAPTSLEGIQGHQWVQQQRGADYEAERSLSGVCAGLTLKGRIDGYWPSEQRIEEIKTFRGDLSRQNPGQRALHWAQLRSYGALLCRELALPEITLQLTYLEIATQQLTEFQETHSAEELWEELEARAEQYAHWHLQLGKARTERDRALQVLRFPFDGFRTGQRDLAESVYKTSLTGRQLLIEASTGLGKTLGTLFPALRSLPNARVDKLIYLSTRNTVRRVGLEGLEQIQTAQSDRIPLRVVELCAKEDVCVHPDSECQGESCPLAKGFFDRLPTARQHAFEQTDPALTRDALATLAAEHQVCPYFLGQEMARWADLIFADMNQYLAPSALLYGYLKQDDWRALLLCDEAHNLVDRSRDLYSATLQQQPLASLPKSLSPNLTRAINRIKRGWQQLAKQLDGETSQLMEQLPSGFYSKVQKLCSALTEALTENPNQPELQNLLFNHAAYLKLCDSFDTHSIIRLTRPRAGAASIEIRNLDPSEFLKERWQALHALCLFSATLNPAEYFRDLLGLSRTLISLRAPAPFSSEQLRIEVDPRIDTRFQYREHSVAPIVQRLVEQFSHAPGNYLFFTSSFSYLNAIVDALRAAAPQIPLNIQTPGMNAAERQEFIQAFTNQSQILGLAVLGGLFSEGVDLPGERLIGVAIATLGLPPFDEISRQMERRMEQCFGQGYNYTYLYPGIQKVVQAAGRLIRTETDRGHLLLLDRRFQDLRVQRLFPDWWPSPETPKSDSGS